ncbi:hypothetical protein ACFQH5_20355 [Halomonas salifodinae]|uniref:Uncharacterized protein n=1 Tax=Halomonas salifodinae TaxID=438745 RepID=A0ABW2F785_9GAMM
MSIRPLEPGCLALVINDPEAGMAVECVEFKPTGFKFRSSIDGEVYATGEPAWITNDPDGQESIRPARTLLRIDDHGEDADDYEVIREEWGITA